MSLRQERSWINVSEEQDKKTSVDASKDRLWRN